MKIDIVRVWLVTSAIMCLIMVLIGGFTRLTHSGLSIVEWKPITGIIPPLSQESWEDEFTKYKLFPEYKHINFNIDLAEFKKIFLIEYIHRIFARLTGFVICVPLILFYITRKIPFTTNKSYLLLPIMLIMQAIMGWYMVKSGLNNNPHVSHIRLSVHLILAALLYGAILHKLLETKISYTFFQIFTICIIYAQIFVGGMVAGLNAGMIYNTFPYMGNSLIPDEVMTHNLSSIWYEPVSIQFIHRALAFFTLICSILLAYHTKNKYSWLIIISVVIQIIIGIITLILSVPMSLGLLHQIFAFLLLTSAFLTTSRDAAL